MDAAQIKTYAMYLAKSQGLVEDGLSDFVDSAIALALNDFWGRKSWRFARTTYDLSITAEAESYDLPDNFESVIWVKQQDSQTGGPLTYVTSTEFERCTPKPTAFSAGYPSIFTIYYDVSALKSKIKLYPVPASGYTVKMLYKMKCPGSVANVPNGYESGFLAALFAFMYKPGSPQRLSALADYNEQVRILEIGDSPFSGEIDHILDPSEIRITNERVWL